MSRTNVYRSALSFAVPPCLIGAPGGTLVGVFVPRYETDSTFASTSLQRNETAIAFASDGRPFWRDFDLAKVLVVSMGRAAWRAKVLPVSKLPRHRVLSAKIVALLALERVRARNSSPNVPKLAKNTRFMACWASFFADEPLKAPCWANFFAEVPRASC